MKTTVHTWDDSVKTSSSSSSSSWTNSYRLVDNDDYPEPFEGFILRTFHYEHLEGRIDPCEIAVNQRSVSFCSSGIEFQMMVSTLVHSRALFAYLFRLGITLAGALNNNNIRILCLFSVRGGKGGPALIFLCGWLTEFHQFFHFRYVTGSLRFHSGSSVQGASQWRTG